MGRSVPVHAVYACPLLRSPRPALPTLLCKVSPQGAGAAASGRPGPACSWPDAAPADPQFVPPPPSWFPAVTGRLQEARGPLSSAAPRAKPGVSLEAVWVLG